MKLPAQWDVPWSGRGDRYTAAEIATVVEAMREADPQTQGRHQEEFERRFGKLMDAEHCFAMSSGTGALELSALLCRLKAGDEVVLPAHTFAATAIPFARTGAKLVWADIHPDTRVVTAETLAPKITPRTKVLIVVHLYGLVADMDPILELARRKNILVVEDAAQSIGARYKKRRSGTMGDFGCYSFHTHKNISTLGEGGMLAVKNPELAALVPGLRHNGVRSYPEPREKYWIPAMSDVDFDLDGVWPYNFCIGEAQCALGSKLLERVDRVNAQRRSRARKVMEALRDFPELNFQSQPGGCEHAHHLLAARYDGARFGVHRDDFIARMVLKHRIKPAVQYYPLYRYPLFKKAGFGAADCPNTDAFFDNMVSFPFQNWMTDAQTAKLIAAARETCAHLRKEAPAPAGSAR